MVRDRQSLNDILYFCTLIEFIARKTNLSRKEVIDYFTLEDISNELQDADINHCNSFEEVSDETIARYGIKASNDLYGNNDSAPSFLKIGFVYKNLVSDIADSDTIAKTIKDVFSSFISEEISNYDSDIYFASSDYLKICFLEGKLIDY